MRKVNLDKLEKEMDFKSKPFSGPDEQLKQRFMSKDTVDSAAVFFFFDRSGDLHIEGRAGPTQEAQDFLRDVLFVLHSWISQEQKPND